MGFMFLIKFIIYEKERRLREIMRVMGLGDLTFWVGRRDRRGRDEGWVLEVSWLLTGLAVGIPVACLLTLLGWVGGMWVESDTILVLVFLVLFVVSLTTQAFAVSTIFNKESTAPVASFVIYAILALPAMVIISESSVRISSLSYSHL